MANGERRGSNSAAVLAVAIMICVSVLGCVRRTMTITTDPPQARVFLNDQEIGRSEVSTDFLWYGDYDVVIRKEGYQTLQTNWTIEPPWYQWIPFDFFAEVLWPGWVHDLRTQHFALTPATAPTEEEVIERAEGVRQDALGAPQSKN
jgi:hypothetical protein